MRALIYIVLLMAAGCAPVGRDQLVATTRATVLQSDADYQATYRRLANLSRKCLSQSHLGGGARTVHADLYEGRGEILLVATNPILGTRTELVIEIVPAGEGSTVTSNQIETWGGDFYIARIRRWLAGGDRC